VTAEDVIDLYSGLLARGVQLWVDGRWGIDALLEHQARPHKDFDAIVAFEDLPTLTRFLSGFALKAAPQGDLLTRRPRRSRRRRADKRSPKGVAC
jgi:hypothetical protein